MVNEGGFGGSDVQSVIDAAMASLYLSVVLQNIRIFLEAEFLSIFTKSSKSSTGVIFQLAITGPVGNSYISFI